MLPSLSALCKITCVHTELKTEYSLQRRVGVRQRRCQQGPSAFHPILRLLPISLIKPRSRWTKIPTSTALICSRSFRSAPAEGKLLVTTMKWPVTKSQVVKGASRSSQGGTRKPSPRSLGGRGRRYQ